MDMAIVKQAIRSECKKRWGELTLSQYALQVVYETENVDILEGHAFYKHQLSDYTPLIEWTALGGGLH